MSGDWFKKKLMDFPNILSLTGETDWKRGWQTDRETAVWLWRWEGRERHMDMWGGCEDGAVLLVPRGPGFVVGKIQTLVKLLEWDFCLMSRACC